MDIGISTFLTEYSIDAAVLARRAEELGFDSFWMPEHPVIPVNLTTQWPASPGQPLPKHYAHVVDPFAALARASAVTTRLKLATGIALVPQRSPLLLAKQVATLDMYSGGRFVFGIAAGWLKEELEIFGVDFDHRWTQTREAVLAMKQLWTRTESEYHGKYYDFPPVYSFPRPTQRPHPPIPLGGTATNVFKRIVAWGDGWVPNRVTPEEIARGRATLDRLAEEAGRDPASIQISVFDLGLRPGEPRSPDLVKQFEEAGADGVSIRLRTAAEPDSLAELEEIAETVLR